MLGELGKTTGRIGSLLRAQHLAAPRLTKVTAALILVSAALPAVFTVASGALVGAVPGALEDGAGFEARAHLFRLLLLVGALSVVQQVLGHITDVCTDDLGRRTQAWLRQRVLDAAIAPVGIAHLEDPELLDQLALARGVEDDRFSPARATGAGKNLAITYLGAAGATLVLARWHPVLALALAAAFIVFGHLARRKFHVIVRVLANQVPGLRRSNWFATAAMGDAAKELRVFGLGGFLTERFRTHWLEAMAEVWRGRSGIAPTFAIVTPFLALARFAGFAAVAMAGARGDLSLAEVAAYTQAILGISAFAELSDDSWNCLQGLVPIPAALAVDEAVAALPGADGDVDARELPRQSIRFEGVHFAYARSDVEVFTGLDLEIAAGRSTAIVGLNGAGKTTLVKLLARLYEPDRGRIAVDGVPLVDLDVASWRRRLAAIFQDFIRYQMPVRANVGFGAPALFDDEEVLARAAARAGATEIIDALPAAWDTFLSPRFTDGVELSGGQWQRIALARALLAVEAGAGVLVLDEPTAQLDVRAEAEIYERFLELTAGLTTVVISHRFSTVRRADRIVVLEGGCVVESGNHEELMAAGGRYSRLFQLQAARFRSGGDDDDDEVGLEAVR